VEVLRGLEARMRASSAWEAAAFLCTSKEPLPPAPSEEMLGEAVRRLRILRETADLTRQRAS
jgi:hypothetical protein